MVEAGGQCDPDYPSEKIRENAEYEHDGEVFSLNYADRGDLFDGLKIWESEEFRNLQGSYPVISLSFANVKERNYLEARRKTSERFCPVM